MKWIKLLAKTMRFAMKKICSFFSRLLSVFINYIFAPVAQTRIGFDIEEPFNGLEFDSIHKRNLQESLDEQF